MPLTSSQMQEVLDNCQSLSCTRSGFTLDDGEIVDHGKCIGGHCPYCGDPCGYYGHDCEVRRLEEQEQETRIMTDDETEFLIETEVTVTQEELEELKRKADKLDRIESEGNPADIDLVEAPTEKIDLSE